MPDIPNNFIGIEPPKTNVNAPTWRLRILALHQEHKGQWAKYGPYANYRYAQNAASRIRERARKWFPYLIVETVTEQEYIDSHITTSYIKIRVIDKDDKNNEH